MNKAIGKKIEKIGIEKSRKHLFFCIGPDCCPKKEGAALWEHAKKRLKSLDFPVMRTKAACFRICQGGPWLVVYPEGIWYGDMTEERFERILQEHLIEGNPVREWIAVENSLAACRT
ncbi:MAG: hypothetical protein WD490_00255 [Opitutales bacterium]